MQKCKLLTAQKTIYGKILGKHVYAIFDTITRSCRISLYLYVSVSPSIANKHSK